MMLKRLINGYALSTLIGAASALAILTVVKTLFNQYAPVMDYIAPNDVWIKTDTYYQNEFIGKKLRDCVRIPESEAGYIYLADGSINETGFQYVKDDSPHSSFPPGVVNIGGIRWQKLDRTLSPVVAVGFSVRHICNGEMVYSSFRFPLEEQHDKPG